MMVRSSSVRRNACRRIQALLAANFVASVSGCAHVPHVSTAARSTTTERTPSPLFTAVVQTIVDSSHTIVRKLFGTAMVTLQIDPRPLRTARLGGVETSEDALLMAAGPVLRTLSAAELSGRVAVLRQAGIPVGDISSLDKCPGLLGLATAEERRACPIQRTVIVAFGVLDSATTRAAVQVVVLAAEAGEHQGKFGRITSYEMERRQGRWRLGGLGQTIIIE